MHLAPHLLLRADAAASPAGALLRAAGYIVSRVDDDALAEELAGAPHVDGVVVELPALATIQFGRKLAARYGDANVLLLAITHAVQTVQRAIPTALALTPRAVEDDLISTVDLALAARQRMVLMDAS
jgi:DNA-binding NarL/FixJ family response regulator